MNKKADFFEIMLAGLVVVILALFFFIILMSLIYIFYVTFPWSIMLLLFPVIVYALGVIVLNP